MSTINPYAGTSLGEAAASEGGAHSPYLVPLTEQHRALILRRLLFQSGPRIPEDRLRSLAAQGIPDCDKSLRPLIWRLFLQLLDYDRDGWEAHLQDQRNIYAQFVSDLCVLPEDTDEGEGRRPETTPVKDGQQQAQQLKEHQEEKTESAAVPSLLSGGLLPEGPAAPDRESAPPKTKKKLLVPSSTPPSSSSSSLDLDAFESGATTADDNSNSTRSRSASASTSTSTSGRGGHGTSMLGASAAGSQPHFASARPKTRVRFQGDRGLFDEIKRVCVCFFFF